MPTEYTEQLPIEITTYRSKIDGSIVVEIDQEPDADDDHRIRVNLNDGIIFDGHTNEVSVLDPTEARVIAEALEGLGSLNGFSAGIVRNAIRFLRGER